MKPNQYVALCSGRYLGILRFQYHVSYRLNCLEGVYVGDDIGDYYRAHKGDMRSLDNVFLNCPLGGFCMRTQRTLLGFRVEGNSIPKHHHKGRHKAHARQSVQNTTEYPC